MDSMEQETSNLIYKMRTKFFDMFSSYEIHSLRECLKKIPLQQRTVIALFYGLDGKQCYDYKQIARKYNTTIEFTIKLLNTGIRNLTNLLDGKEVIVDVNKNDRSNDLLKKYLVDNDNEAYLELVDESMWLVHSFADKYRDQEDYEEFISVASLALLKAIETSDVNRLKGNDFLTYAYIIIRNDVYRQFLLKKKNDKMYSLDESIENEDGIIVDDIFIENEDYVDELIEKEEIISKRARVHEALNSLDKRERMIIEYLYGFKDGKKHSQDEITKMSGLPATTVSAIVRRACNKLSRQLEDYEQEYVLPGDINKKVKERSKTFYSMFSEQDREKLLNVLHKLKNNSYVILYYGLNGKEALDYIQIAEKFGVSEEDVVSKVEFILDKLKKLSKLEIAEGQKLADNKYFLLAAEFGEAAVKDVVSTLNKKDSEFISLFYGIDCRRFSISEMVKRYGVTRQACYQKNNRIMANVEKKLNQKYSLINKQFYELFDGASKEQVDKAFACLYEDEQEILSLAYGFKCIKLTRDKIAKKCGCSVGTVSKKVKNSIEKMNKLIRNDELEDDKRYKFYSKFDGYTREQINYAYSRLDPTSQKFLSLYFGLEGRAVSYKKIAEDHKMCVQSLWNTIYRAIAEMKKILENPNIKILNKRGRPRKVR